MKIKDNFGNRLVSKSVTFSVGDMFAAADVLFNIEKQIESNDAPKGVINSLSICATFLKKIALPVMERPTMFLDEDVNTDVEKMQW